MHAIRFPCVAAVPRQRHEPCVRAHLGYAPLVALNEQGQPHIALIYAQRVPTVRD